MSGTEFIDRLKSKFGDRITGFNLEAIDPWIEVSPAGLVDVCMYLRDEPDLRFNMLLCISGVDYFEPDPKKAAKIAAMSIPTMRKSSKPAPSFFEIVLP